MYRFHCKVENKIYGYEKINVWFIWYLSISYSPIYFMDRNIHIDIYAIIGKNMYWLDWMYNGNKFSARIF